MSGINRHLSLVLWLWMVACVDRGVVGVVDSEAGGGAPAAPPPGDERSGGEPNDDELDDDDDLDEDDELDEDDDLDEDDGRELDRAEPDAFDLEPTDGPTHQADRDAGLDAALSECRGALCTEATPFCVAGQCVECREDRDCPSDECDDGVCEPPEEGDDDD